MEGMTTESWQILRKGSILKYCSRYLSVDALNILLALTSLNSEAIQLCEYL